MHPTLCFQFLTFRHFSLGFGSESVVLFFSCCDDNVMDLYLLQEALEEQEPTFKLEVCGELLLGSKVNFNVVVNTTR